jgi:hypothetical protein
MQGSFNWVALGSVGALVLACSAQPLVISAQPPAIMKISPPFWFEAWAPQDVATNVQDWDRAARMIADGLAEHGMLAGGLPGAGYAQSRSSPGNTFFLRFQQDSMFLQQLKEALETEITNRGGTTTALPAGAFVIDLRVDVIQWGSRLSSQPYMLRSEAVWQAALLSGGKTVLSIRQPFYIRDADVPLYENIPPPDPLQRSVDWPQRQMSCEVPLLSRWR